MRRRPASIVPAALPTRRPASRSLRAGVTAGLAVALVAACSSADPVAGRTDTVSGPVASATATPPGASGPSGATSAPASTPSATSTTSATPSTTPSTTAPASRPAANPVSIQALIDKTYTGGDLRLGTERGSTSAYRQYYATYRGNGLTISGRINIPRGDGPFPAVVLAHGYVDVDEYTNGETMLRERDYLARQGYVTLHIDYRNHAQSSKDPDAEGNLRLGYTEDAITAALALQKDSRVDPDRIALIGRSMGGGVVYNALVVKPGLFKAAVAYAPVSSDTVDNFDKWTRGDDERSGAAARIIKQIGTPEDQPRNWAAVSPRTYFSRITEPLMIHHGTADEDCPIAWSEETVAALKKAGKPVTFHVYPGQRHTMVAQWPLSIRRSEAFIADAMG
jgi:dienelactone hydrolase